MALTLEEARRLICEQPISVPSQTASVGQPRIPFKANTALAEIPASKAELRDKAIRTVLDAHELSAEVFKALENISKLPGVVEAARWASTRGPTFRVSGEWEVTDGASEAVIERLKASMQDAILEWCKRDEIRQAYSAQLATFLDRAKGLEERGLVDSALDLVYDSVDELLRRGQFALCDSVLSEIVVDGYSTDLLLAMLTATAPARSHLNVRRAFFRKVKKALKARKEYERSLLDGLG